MNKNILARLMELDNKKADAYLAKFANEIKNKILKSKDNDEIFRNIELLEEFVYKAPSQALVVVRTVIRDKKSNKTKTYKGGFFGRDHKDLVLKSISLLEKIRYIKPVEAFSILISLHKSKNEQIKSESARILEKLAKYDSQVLEHIGYSVQRKLLDIITEWTEEKKIKNIEIIKITSKELLKPSFEGTSMKDYKTMVFQSGSLQPTEFLKKIRRDTIDLILGLYYENKDIKTKINLLEILYGASKFPHHSNYEKEKEFEKMVTDDVAYLVDKYNKIIFGKEKKIVTDAPITQEIERQLVWFNKNHKDEIPKISILLKSIRKDEFYDLYRTLAGDTLRLDRIEKESWQEAEEEINKKIDSEFKKINKRNIKKWSQKLNLIAKYKNVVDEWKFQRLHALLHRIAKEKPDLAEINLEDAFKNSSPLRSFAGQFLFGFRDGNNIELWDEYAEKIVEEKSVGLIKNIPDSLFSNLNLKDIRQEDVDLLSRIVKKEKPFNFLKRVKEGNELLNLNFSLLRALIKIYGKDKKQIEALIMVLIKSDENYLHMYIEQLGYPAYENTIDLSEWDKKNIKFILNKLVELKDLDYEAQLLLLGIAKNDFPSAMDVFIKRIRKRDKMTTKKWISHNEYDAIPYHFNDKLSDFINNQKEFIDIFEDWTREMSEKTSIYNMELAQLLQKIGGSTSDKVLRNIIKKGNKTNLNRAVALMWSINSPDFDICFEIIKKAGKGKIWKDVGGLMFNTGVVSGEYGFAEAHERKIKAIKEYKISGTKKEMGRIKKFKKEIIRALQETAKRERQKAKEDIKLRKLEFGE